VVAAAVTLPKSIGRLRLRDPRAAPDIHYNFFADRNDLDRLVEARRELCAVRPDGTDVIFRAAGRRRIVG
jgi:hypothetical protein